MKVVVAVPVRDEEERLAACLDALDGQVLGRADQIVLLLNNCTDRSAEVARGMRPRLRSALHVVEVQLPPNKANAGHARGLAMDEAARLAGDAGVVLTTDADGRVDQDWIGSNLAALRAGADLVAGWAELEPADWGTITLAMHQDDARECSYDAVCDELNALLDPDPADPFPRHTQASGASLGLTVAAYQAAGGVPRVACGEDRALVAALRRIDAPVRHAPECRVVVSGRTTGRAAGGMADTISRRLSGPDPYLDDRLEPAVICARRAALRHLARAVFLGQIAVDRLAAASLLDPWMLEGVMRETYFGMAWSTIEAAAPDMRRLRVAAGEVAPEQALADALLRRARRDLERLREDLLAGLEPACQDA